LQALSERIQSVHSVHCGEAKTSTTEILFLSPTASKPVPINETDVVQLLILHFSERAGHGSLMCKPRSFTAKRLMHASGFV
jgi:hypothetical protein